MKIDRTKPDVLRVTEFILEKNKSGESFSDYSIGSDSVSSCADIAPRSNHLRYWINFVYKESKWREPTTRVQN
jgi:hypothetical protein